MKAAVVEGFNQPLVVHKDWPDPKCGPNDAIIQVKANGICRSDWHMWMGDWGWIGLQLQLPHVIGHEFCGVVEEVGSEVTKFKKGDHVICPFNLGCGSCEYCLSGHQNTCSDLKIAGLNVTGGYGQFAHIPKADFNLVPLPESISFVEAASMGCRFMTAYHGVVDQAQVKAGEWVAVYGCGGVGLATVQIASALGANVIAISNNEKKLSAARELGATHVVNASQEDAPTAVQDITKGGAHVSIEALGSAGTCRNAILSLRNQGRLLQVGLTSEQEKGEVSLPIDLIVAKELMIIGTLGMQPHRYSEMLRMVESGKLTPGKLVNQTVPIEQASDVLSSMSHYGTLGVTVIDQW
ncbi:MAG: zinc-dependent alcohol dehydrogenase family protein [Iphinoe sp. HA4291-MV1]|jgi:D-arabinose 1-dehydrogenase-like Zn-dependent alcohol dehydrogenase|nr:zinc-dependent alcohol dehydrogenase family protein [Iphinoe sp. HA4291-MV1]